MIMSYLGVIAWMIIGLTIALAYCYAAKPSSDDKKSGADNISYDSASVCKFLKNLLDSEIYIFDSDLKLIGPSISEDRQSCRGTHILDVIPQSCIEDVLQNIIAAKKGGKLVWRSTWKGRDVSFSAVSIGDNGHTVLLIGTDL